MKHKIGITEAGDAGLDRSWASKLDTVDGAIAITKNAALDFRAIAATNRDKLIVHITCTGYGGTIVEPYVPPMQEQLSNALDLVRRGLNTTLPMDAGSRPFSRSRLRTLSSSRRISPIVQT